MVANVANEIVSKFLEICNQVLPEEGLTMAEIRPFELPKKALIVPTRFIGDNILLIPFLKNLSHNMGANGKIDVVATPATAPLYRTLPYINDVLLEITELKSPQKYLEENAYDTIIMCRYAPVWSRAAQNAGIEQRVGYDLERLGIHRLQRWGQSLTHVIPSTPMFDTRPQVEIYLDILRYLGLDVVSDDLKCELTHGDRAKAKELLAQLPEGRPRILIHAGSGSPGKNWPIENWAQLMGILAPRYNPVFIAVGGNGEASLYKPLEEQFEFYNFCGKSNLRESIALMEEVDLVISLDTSVAHMATLAEVPRLVVLYGPTNHAQWRPWTKNIRTQLQQVYLDLKCRPCLARTCENKRCVMEVTPEHVLMAVEKLLADQPFGGQ